MSDDMRLTRSEFVEAQRAAFVSGAVYAEFTSSPAEPVRRGFTAEVVAAAEMKFPLPKVKRLREVPDPHDERLWWRHDPAGRGFVMSWDRRIWTTPCGSDRWATVEPTHLRVKVWADLAAAPTEEVDT